jgi:hypothetical protein
MAVAKGIFGHPSQMYGCHKFLLQPFTAQV